MNNEQNNFCEGQTDIIIIISIGEPLKERKQSTKLN